MNDLSEIYVDPNECATALLGSNYLQNYLTGGTVSKGIGVLTQKRFYYRGRNFVGAGKEAKATTEEGMVSIEDITFTKLVRTCHIGMIVWATLCFLAGLVVLTMKPEGYWALLPYLFFLGSLAYCVQFFITFRTHFVVSFPGGAFGFDMRYYPITDVRDFQRQLHLLKDNIKNNA